MNKFLCYLLGVPSVKTIGKANELFFKSDKELFAITLDDFITDLGAAIQAANTPRKVYVDTDYTLTGVEDVIFCSGALTLTLQNNGKHNIIIRANGGTVTLLTQGSNTVEQSTIVDGVALQLSYNANLDRYDRL